MALGSLDAAHKPLPMLENCIATEVWAGGSRLSGRCILCANPKAIAGTCHNSTRQTASYSLTALQRKGHPNVLWQ